MKIIKWIKNNFTYFTGYFCVMIVYTIKHIKGVRLTVVDYIIGAIISGISIVVVELINKWFGKKNKDDHERQYDLSNNTNITANNIKKDVHCIDIKASDINYKVNELVDDMNFRKGQDDKEVSLNDVFAKVQNVYEENLKLKNDLKEQSLLIEHLTHELQDYKREYEH